LKLNRLYIFGEIVIVWHDLDEITNLSAY